MGRTLQWTLKSSYRSRSEHRVGYWTTSSKGLIRWPNHWKRAGSSAQKYQAWKKPWFRWSDSRSPCEWRCPIESFLLTMVTTFWSTENTSADLIDPNITVLCKKGDRSHCGNYRGISLLSVVGKVFANIILQRLKNLAELIYAQSQSGYIVVAEAPSTVFSHLDNRWKSQESSEETCT